MRLRLLAIFLLLPYSREATASPKYETEPQDISYCQLAGDPGKFSGKRIRIQAIYSYMFEVSSLRPPTCCTEHERSRDLDAGHQGHRVDAEFSVRGNVHQHVQEGIQGAPWTCRSGSEGFYRAAFS